jgi:GDP-4-dehydro-6-deoxy-D-mannose reductase
MLGDSLGYKRPAGQAPGLLEISEVKDIKLEQDPTRLRPSDVQILLGDCTKIMEKTGWKPEIPFEKTLTDLRDFWRDRL